MKIIFKLNKLFLYNTSTGSFTAIQHKKSIFIDDRIQCDKIANRFPIILQVTIFVLSSRRFCLKIILQISTVNMK